MTSGEGARQGNGEGRLARLEERVSYLDRLVGDSNSNHTDRIRALELNNAGLRGDLSAANGRIDRMFYWVLGLGGAAILLLIRLSFE